MYLKYKCKCNCSETILLWKTEWRLVAEGAEGDGKLIKRRHSSQVIQCNSYVVSYVVSSALRIWYRHQAMISRRQVSPGFLGSFSLNRIVESSTIEPGWLKSDAWPHGFPKFRPPTRLGKSIILSYQKSRRALTELKSISLCYFRRWERKVRDRRQTLAGSLFFKQSG